MCIYCDLMEVMKKNISHADIDQVCPVHLKSMGMPEESVYKPLKRVIGSGLFTKYLSTTKTDSVALKNTNQ